MISGLGSKSNLRSHRFEWTWRGEKAQEWGRVVVGDCAGAAGERDCVAPNEHDLKISIFRRTASPVWSVKSRAAYISVLASCAQWFVLVLLVISSLPTVARADTIATNLTNAFGTSNSAFGQSLTTPGGGPWANIAFNFYSISSNPYASGSLYLLDHEYTGTLANLSAQTNLGVATASVSAWIFNPSVTLQAGTQYWFYMGSTSGGTSLLWGGGDAFGGGNKYSASAAGAYQTEPTNDMAFKLTGTQSSPGPIPGAGLLSYVIFGIGGAAAFRKRLSERVGAAIAMLKRKAPALAGMRFDILNT